MGKRKLLNLGFILLLLAIPTLLSPVSGTVLADVDYWPTDEWITSTDEWITSTPEEQGMNSTKLIEMEAFVNDSALSPYGMIVVRNGYIVHEKYYYSVKGHNITEEINSCTASVMSALIGIAIDQGFIDNVSQTVLSFFPDKVFANPDARKDAMTIEHLLTMTHGLNYEENTGAPHILSAILQNVTGTTTASFAETYLFTPLGITDYEWDVDDQGVNDGGRGLSLTPHDMAKFGFLYLNNGTWDETQVISEDWVRMSGQGLFHVNSIKRYGLGWWNYTGVGAYNAVGFTARVISVVPEHSLVVVMTGYDNTGDFMRNQFRQALLDWIIPATQDDVTVPTGPSTSTPSVPNTSLPIDPVLLIGVSGAAVLIVVGVILIKRRT
ncbi:MAG: serine hydrolase domain-containing protein [Candidatus Thorarchaeota archaeon]